jgi:hypothetical protein
LLGRETRRSRISAIFVEIEIQILLVIARKVRTIVDIITPKALAADHDVAQVILIMTKRSAIARGVF